MTFYNPNIQANFEANNNEAIVLRNKVLATYRIVYKIREGCSVNSSEDINASYQLEFVQFENAIQQQNLELVNANFDTLIAEIALEVITGRVKSFEDFLRSKLENTLEIERNEVLYIGDAIQDYIELLVYSDIAGIKPATCIRNFTKLLGMSSPETDIPVFYNLYDRLKLYARLRKDIKLIIDRKNIKLTDREVILKLKICI